MNQQDRKKIVLSLVALADMCGRNLQEPTLAMWLKMLSPYTPEQVSEGITKVLANRKYSTMPMPAEVIEAIVGSSQDKGLMEAHRVLDTLRRVGSYESVVFDDPVTQAVIAEVFGGWVNLGETALEENRPFFEKQFTEAYQGFAKAGKRRGGFLMGRFDSSKPVAIGDKAQAAAVLQLGSAGPQRAKMIEAGKGTSATAAAAEGV